MTRKHYAFGALALAGTILLLGAFGPWFYRAVTERLTLCPNVSRVES